MILWLLLLEWATQACKAPATVWLSKNNMVLDLGQDLKSLHGHWWHQESWTSTQSPVTTWTCVLTAVLTQSHSGPEFWHRILGLACPLWDLIPLTSTWLQTLGIHRTLGCKGSHRHQHRPPQLHQGHGPCHGYWKQPRHRHLVLGDCRAFTSVLCSLCPPLLIWLST